MSKPRPADPVGSIGWAERTGGVLTARECLTLARPLLRAELAIVAGRLAMMLGRHSGRRRSIDPASLAPPDSALARDAGVAAQELLTPVLLHHSSRAYTWGAAIAALQGITFDRELLYLAAMFHDTRIPSPVPDVDFTVRSAALAREFTDRHDVPADSRRLQAGVRRGAPSRGQAGPSRPRLVPAPLRPERPEHSARALPRLKLRRRA